MDLDKTWVELVAGLQESFARSHRLSKETEAIIAFSEVIRMQAALLRQRAALLREQSHLVRQI